MHLCSARVYLVPWPSNGHAPAVCTHDTLFPLTHTLNPQADSRPPFFTKSQSTHDTPPFSTHSFFQAHTTRLALTTCPTGCGFISSSPSSTPARTTRTPTPTKPTTTTTTISTEDTTTVTRGVVVGATTRVRTPTAMCSRAVRTLLPRQPSPPLLSSRSWAGRGRSGPVLRAPCRQRESPRTGPPRGCPLPGQYLRLRGKGKGRGSRDRQRPSLLAWM